MRKEKSLNSPPIVLPYGEVNVTMLPCHPSHEKMEIPCTSELVRYTLSFEEIVSLLEMHQLSFRRPCSLAHDVSVVWIPVACITVVMAPADVAPDTLECRSGAMGRLLF